MNIFMSTDCCLVIYHQMVKPFQYKILWLNNLVLVSLCRPSKHFNVSHCSFKWAASHLTPMTYLYCTRSRCNQPNSCRRNDLHHQSTNHHSHMDCWHIRQYLKPSSQHWSISPCCLVQLLAADEPNVDSNLLTNVCEVCFI